MPPALRRELDSQPIRATIEYIAERLSCDDGYWTMQFMFEGGYYRKGELTHRQVGADELERIAARR